MPVFVSLTGIVFETKIAKTLTKSMDEEDFSKTLVADGRCLNLDVYHPE